MATKAPTALVLLSGGLDSTVALWWAKRGSYTTIVSLGFSYGSREEKASLRCFRTISRKAGCRNTLVRLDPLRRIWMGQSALLGGDVPAGVDGADREVTRAVWVPARNLVLLSFAASYAETLEGNVDLIVGFNEEEGRTFPDNSKEFVEKLNEVLPYSVLEKKITVVAPLIDLTKKEIVALSQKLGAPVELSCSCYQPKGFLKNRPVHCGVCQSCILRSRGFRSAGVPDPTLYEVQPQ